MAILTRTSVLGIKRESTDGVLEQPTSGADYTPLREGFSFQGGVESLTTNELTGQRETSAPILGKETPTGSIPKYLKGSGTEGSEPDYGLRYDKQSHFDLDRDVLKNLEDLQHLVNSELPYQA